MHQSDWAFSGGKSWFSDHFGSDRLIDSDWIKRKSLAKKDLKEKKDAVREPQPVLAKASVGNTHRANKRTPLKKTGTTRITKSKTNSL